MASIDALAANLRRLDQFARADTAIHRLDPRAKVVATLAFVVAVASFDRYTVAALALRACGRRPRPRTVASLLGALLLQTWQRAERIHMAMLARAYHGEFPGGRTRRFAAGEVCFVLGWIGVFWLLRRYDVARLLGSLVERALP